MMKNQKRRKRNPTEKVTNKVMNVYTFDNNNYSYYIYGYILFT